MRLAGLVALALIAAAPAVAQTMDHSAHAGHGATPDAYDASMASMHDRMAKASGATSAESFHRKMIEHHRGALAMAEVAIREARDPGTVALAKRIATDQTREIAEMNGHLARLGVKPQ